MQQQVSKGETCISRMPSDGPILRHVSLTILGLVMLLLPTVTFFQLFWFGFSLSRNHLGALLILASIAVILVSAPQFFSVHVTTSTTFRRVASPLALLTIISFVKHPLLVVAGRVSDGTLARSRLVLGIW